MYKMTAVFVISVLLLAGTANAQGGKTRFLERKWIGLGLIAGGALTAFVGNKQCRLDGPTTSTRLVEGRQNDRPFTTTYTHEKRLGHCDMLIRSEFLGSVSVSSGDGRNPSPLGEEKIVVLSQSARTVIVNTC